VRRALEPLGVTDLAVSAASLEAAFLALTAEPAAEPELEGATR
jgi:ABC-2 type transport system ATP-binding protein